MQEAGSAGREAQCCPPTVVLGVHRVLESEGFGDLNISNSTRELLWSHFQYLGYASKTHQKSLETKSLQAKLKKRLWTKKRFLNKAPRIGTTTRKPPSSREVLRAASMRHRLLCMCSSRLLLGRHRWTWGEGYCFMGFTLCVYIYILISVSTLSVGA